MLSVEISAQHQQHMLQVILEKYRLEARNIHYLIIEVVYRPLQRIFHIGADAINAAGSAMEALGISFTQVTRDTNIIAQVLAGESSVTSVFTADQLSTITEFGNHMDFFGIDLTRVPQYSLAADNLPLLIFPILAVVIKKTRSVFSPRASTPAGGRSRCGSAQRMRGILYAAPFEIKAPGNGGFSFTPA